MSYSVLNGLRVIESSAFIAAPLAGLTLTQFGAEVIRVDMIGGGIDYGRMPRMPHPEGRGRSLYWTALNKGKRSIAIDLRRPEGRELIQNLVTAPGPDAGVLLTNIGTPWLAHDLLAKKRADVITCTIQGNGDGSTALDYTVNCATGYPYVTGGATAEHPVNHVLPAWDLACAYQAAFALVAAVDRRRRTGEGAQMNLALSDIAFATLANVGLLTEAEVLEHDRDPIGNDIYGAFGRDFGLADGSRIMVAAISLGQWKALVTACEAAKAITELEQGMGRDFNDEEQRFDARHAIAPIFDAWFASRSSEQVVPVLEANKVCWGRYNTVRELLARDARVSTQNPVFERITTPGIGNHITAGSPVRMANTERLPTRPAALLGTDTDRILHEVLGLDAHQIGKLHDQKIVAGPECDPSQS